MYSTIASKPRQETETLFESLDRDTYPLISCDIYTCRDIKSHDKVCQLLQNAIDIACNSSPGKTLKNCLFFTFITFSHFFYFFIVFILLSLYLYLNLDLLAMHLMKSLDSLSCVVVGTWSSLYGLEQLRAIEEYISLIEGLNAIVII